MADTKTSALPAYTNPDPVNDVIPIVDNTNQTTKKISRNNYLGITSAPVGLSDSQALTNKVLTAPTISSPVLSGTITGTYTLGGTPTFPASVVTLTGSQTLTNKVLTSPTINSPTITNASMTTDAITGFTSANNGSIYGLVITGSQLGTAALATNAVQGNQVATSAITLASVSSSTSQGGVGASDVIVTGLTATVTIPSGNRRVRVEAFIPWMSSTNIASMFLSIYNSAIVTGSSVQQSVVLLSLAGTKNMISTVYEHTPAAGSQSYCAAISVDTGTGSTSLSSTRLAYLTVRVL